METEGDRFCTLFHFTDKDGLAASVVITNILGFMLEPESTRLLLEGARIMVSVGHSIGQLLTSEPKPELEARFLDQWLNRDRAIEGYRRGL